MDFKTRSKICLCRSPAFLFESHMEDYFESIWCIVVSDKIALERLFNYRNFTYEQAKERISKQMSPKEKMERSTIIIKNNKSVEDLEIEIKKALKKEEDAIVRNE